MAANRIVEKVRSKWPLFRLWWRFWLMVKNGPTLRLSRRVTEIQNHYQWEGNTKCFSLFLPERTLIKWPIPLDHWEHTQSCQVTPCNEPIVPLMENGCPISCVHFPVNHCLTCKWFNIGATMITIIIALSSLNKSAASAQYNTVQDYIFLCVMYQGTFLSFFLIRNTNRTCKPNVFEYTIHYHVTC